MTGDEIKGMAPFIDNIAADDCALFLWTTPAHAALAHEVIKSWGFTFTIEFVWLKDKLGMGLWQRNKHETLLLATKGKVPCPVMGEQWPSVIEAPRGRHSEKPEKFYELIEAYFPTLPKIELFARKARLGWKRWGNEADEEAA
jgi:N6-adenosine-specific RNA methylase IME4